jgi:hypothetical protein
LQFSSAKEDALNPQELQEMFPGSEGFFNSPMTRSQARFAWEKNRRDMELNGLHNLAESGSIKRLGVGLIGGVAGTLLDPINYSALRTAGLAVNGLATRLAFAPDIISSAGFSTAKNVVEDMALTAVDYSTRRWAKDITGQEDPSLGESAFYSALTNAALYGGSKIIERLLPFNNINNKPSEAMTFRELPDNVKKKIINSEILYNEINHPAMNRRSSMMDHLATKAIKNANHQDLRYIGKQGFFYAHSNKLPGSSGALHLGYRFGKGVVFVDKPAMAASFAETLNEASVLRQSNIMEGAKFLDLTTVGKNSLEGEMSWVVEEISSRFGRYAKRIFPRGDDITLDQVFKNMVDGLPRREMGEVETFFNVFNKRLQDSGYVGIDFNWDENTKARQLFQNLFEADEVSTVINDIPVGSASIDLNMNDIQQAMGIDLPEWAQGKEIDSKIDLVPELQGDRLQPIVVDGVLSNGEKLNMQSNIEQYVDPLLQTQTDFLTDFSDAFSKNKVDRINELVNLGDTDNLVKEFPELSNIAKEAIGDLELAKTINPELNSEKITKQLEKFMEDLKVTNPEKAAILIKATEVCLRRN